MNDIIDRIGELVDEQMSAGETVSDYLTGDHNYPRCPHCGRHWHGLRLTQRIAGMYNLGRMDAEYTVAEDDSRIICEGSEFIGPQRPGPGWPADPLTDLSRWSFAGRAPRMHAIAIAIDDEQMRRWARAATQVVESFFHEINNGPIIRFYDSMFRYLGDVELRTTVCADLSDPPPDVDVKFGPDNWIHEIQRMPPSLQFPRTWPGYHLVTPLQAAVNQHWHELTAPNYPIPISPGYDFSQYADEQPPTAGPPRQPFTRR